MKGLAGAKSRKRMGKVKNTIRIKEAGKDQSAGKLRHMAQRRPGRERVETDRLYILANEGTGRRRAGKRRGGQVIVLAGKAGAREWHRLK